MLSGSEQNQTMNIYILFLLLTLNSFKMLKMFGMFYPEDSEKGLFAG